MKKRIPRRLPSINYDRSRSGVSLFQLWEEGGEGDLPAPLAVWDEGYRRRLVRLLLGEMPLDARQHRILSVGAGNGFLEVDLKNAGAEVLATDRSKFALAFCKRKGLQVRHFDLGRDCPAALGVFQSICCDGVLGHLWTPENGLDPIWRKLSKLVQPKGRLLLSNDLSDSDTEPTLKVTSDKRARFFRPPAGWYLRDAIASRLWLAVSSEIYPYERKGRQSPRRREILLLRRVATGERKGKKGTTAADQAVKGTSGIKARPRFPRTADSLRLPPNS